MSFATISVIGLGYIGLPTAAAFASRQKQVIGVDINQHAVDTINRGEIHIVEPDLASVVKTARTAKLLLKPVSLELISHSRYFETVFTFLLYGDYSE